jgi:hypothetical protein
VTALGAVHLTDADLDRLADLLADRVRDRLSDEGDWFTTTEYAARGLSPSVEAARKRAQRLEAKGSADVVRRGGKLLLRGPSFGSKGTGPRGAT